MESAGLHFICLFLFIIIYLIEFYCFLWFPRFLSVLYTFIVFFEVVPKKKLAPPLPKQVRFKNANRTRKLENRIVSFFFKGCSESIFPSQWSNSGRSDDEKNHIFWIFVDFAIFGSPRADISKNSMDFGARPKDFKAFWSPAKGF